MLKVLFKTIIFALLLIVSTGQIVSAETKLYQYDGKMPFVKMMLNMMVAMGIVDRVPINRAYGLSGYANNPLLRSPWLNSPWSQSAFNTSSPAWGTPGWGVLPQDRYTPYGSQWSSSVLNGWVDEPWETSDWNPETEMPTQTSQPNVPLVQNFYNVPEKTRQNNQSPLRKRVPSERSHQSPNWQSAAKTKKPSPLRKKGKQKQKPCVTDFCGLKKPSLNGLWVTQNGEMMGIKNKRYLWSDGDSRYLSGEIKVQNEYLVANVDDHEKLMRFKYKLAGNHLLTLGVDGTVREFVRMPVNRYRNY